MKRLQWLKLKDETMTNQNLWLVMTGSVLVLVIAVLATLYFLQRKKINQVLTQNDVFQNESERLFLDEEDDEVSDERLAALGFGQDETQAEQPFFSTKTADEISNDKANEIVSINIIANQERGFVGYELIQSLLAVGLRYGAMNIFHRHETSAGNGRVIFSVASAVEPGTFDLSRTGSLSVSGLCFFMSVAESADPLADFEVMYTTAQQLSRDLDGELQDVKHQSMTEDLLESYRNKIVRQQQKDIETQAG